MSYSTVQEADEYIKSHYVSTDTIRSNWNELSQEDKQALLESAFVIIEALPVVGRKTHNSQTSAFPRYPDKTVPNAVKYAEIEQALFLSDSESIEEFNNYKNMIKYGIESYSIGNFKETLLSYGKRGSMGVESELSSDAARRWMYPWLSGGYSIE